TFFARDQDRGGAIVETGGIGRGHGPVLREGGLQARDRFQRRPGLDEFIGGEGDRVTLALRDQHRNDFVLEAARLLGRLGLVLARYGERILHFAGDAVLPGDVLGGDPHVVLVVNVPQTVDDHAIDEL